jgi:hypothetical protein
VVINQTLANRSFGSEDPIGRRIKVGQGDSEWREIVGIVGDVKQYGLGERDSAQVYEACPQHPYFSGFSIVVRTGVVDPASVVSDLRSVVRTLDLKLVLSGAASMAGLGVAAGLVAAWFLRRVIAKLLYGVSPGDSTPTSPSQSSSPVWRWQRAPCPGCALRGWIQWSPCAAIDAKEERQPSATSFQLSAQTDSWSLAAGSC